MNKRPFLLTTKLYTPRIQKGVVPRRHLIERLDQGLQRGHILTLISAPAGFGKTTLLSAWLKENGRATAWLSLDADDNDQARWLTYFIAALQEIEPAIGESALLRLQSPRPGSTSQMLTALINEIDTIAEPFIVVLDDYHLIHDSHVHEAVTFLLDHASAKMHLVIATRADPPLPLPRLRVGRLVTELRESNLRFTDDEMTAFLNEIKGFDLAASDIEALAQRTEGWIAGLQLAALSLQESANRQKFIQSFTGSHRYVLDYLAEEVLDHQPPQIQQFLMKTAVLDRMCASLCEVLTPQSPVHNQQSSVESPQSSQAILEHLEASNLFTLPLDDERHWYRYHHLFVDLLRKRLQERMPEQIGMLHQQASLWFEENDDVGAAIQHALAGDDAERAVQLIENNAESVLLRSEGTTLVRWVDALPPVLVRERPFLQLYYAWTLLLSGRPIDEVDVHLPEEIHAKTPIVAGANAIRAFVAMSKGAILDSYNLSKHALDYLPQESLFFRSLATWIFSIMLLAKGDLETGMQALEDAVKLGRKTGNIMTAVMAKCIIGELQMARGSLNDAVVTYQEALAWGTDSRKRPLPIAGMALVGLGDIARERNDLEQATQLVNEGIKLCQLWGEVGAMDGFIAMARVKQAQGDVAEAFVQLDHALELARKFDASELDDRLVEAHQARMALMSGDVETAVRWADHRDMTIDQILAQLKNRNVPETYHDNRFRTLEILTFCRLLIQQNKSDDAIIVLTAFQKWVSQMMRTGMLLELLNLKALAYHAQQNQTKAVAAISQVLKVAQPERFKRLLLDEGPPMWQLIKDAAARGVASDYVQELLDVVGETAVSFHPTPLLDPLSDRELDVLRLLATGLSAPEIAAQLIIAKSTVRSHVKSIYSKLGVHRKWDAVQRATELSLL